MGWAVWLAVPIVATTITSLWTGWRSHRAARTGKLDTPAAMRAHQNYLDALTIPARSEQRPPLTYEPSGSVSVSEWASPAGAAEVHSRAS